MPDWFDLGLLLKCPIWVVVAGIRLGFTKVAWSATIVVALAAAAPGIWLFLASRDADAITNAAALFVAPAAILFWGFPVAVTAFAIAGRRRPGRP